MKARITLTVAASFSRLLTRFESMRISLHDRSDSQSFAGFSDSLGIIVPPAKRNLHSFCNFERE